MTMSGAYRLRGATVRDIVTSRLALQAAVAMCVLGGSAVVAFLVGSGKPEFAFALLLSVPLGLAVVRHPQSVIAVWLALAPFLVATDGGVTRKVYWVIHRGLPLGIIGWIVLGVIARTVPRRLPRLGWPEAAMGAYLIATILSVLYQSDQVMASIWHVYDRVFIPMCLYLLIRLVQPGRRDVEALLPVVVFLLLTQTLIGVTSWVAPDVLPGPWLDRAGSRTTGSLSHPNVYGTTMLFAGVVVAHALLHRELPAIRRAWLWPLVPISLLMVFMTYSRASWLAGLVVVLGLLFMHPGYVSRLGVVALLVLIPVVASGAVAEEVERAQLRFLSESSEESALSRLPVVYASLRMVQEKPSFGWGYGNFDRFDRQFQGAVGGLVIPGKDHASHNLYLTILAEQGATGLVLYLLPALWWLAKTPRALRNMPVSGVISRKLLIMLWLVLAAFVIVSNYANMRVVFGLGLYWATLGAVGALVSQHAEPAPPDDELGAQGSREHHGPRGSAAALPAGGWST